MESALKGIGFNLSEKDEKGEKEGGEGLMIAKKALYHPKVVQYIIVHNIPCFQHLEFPTSCLYAIYATEFIGETHKN